LSSALSREWLETNGLGGFACSTVVGLNTRRYHGLLVAALKPPGGRFVLLSKLEEVLEIRGKRFDLSANQYPGTVHPRGFQFLQQFCLDPFPVFVYRVGDVEIEKSVFMPQGENSTVVQYKLRSSNGVPCSLELRPLIAFRDYHCTTHENEVLDARIGQGPGTAWVEPYAGLPALHFAHNAGELSFQGYWYHNFEYAKERERGLDFTEDLFNPFVLRFALGSTNPAVVIASVNRCSTADVERLEATEASRRRSLENCSFSDEFAQSLAVAADQFIVSRGEKKTIVAGYPWFTDWGRDTMIALPGLTLLTGHTNNAKQILLQFAQHSSQGMLPNRFPESGEQPEYNTVDAALWYFEAVRMFLEYTGDYDFLRQHLYPVLTDIVAWYARGTRYGIKVDATGLVTAGEPGVQLTWMDAKVGDWVVTPRHGKPVEIQALWYNALRIMEEWAILFGDGAARKRFAVMAAIAQWSFNRLFWNEASGCLYDVVTGAGPDRSIRPNQILAVSLPHTMLSEARARGVVEVVHRELLTPFGLRTLSSSDPRYRGRYVGGSYERDSAYHQGTVWPWLMGPFITAYLKVNGYADAAREQAAQWLDTLWEHLFDAGLGQISEIFDGDPPHEARGCMAQAWSVAELLRARVEALQLRPQELTGLAKQAAMGSNSTLQAKAPPARAGGNPLTAVTVKKMRRSV
jgi:predicted glycogen debranching enzyme